MTASEHTLDDLVRLTGFSKRQIRFYISKRLVPGAGDRRGPYTVYPPATLLRLQGIKVLKDKKIEPTGRRMTLDEIGHSLDTLSPDGLDALLGGRAELTIMDTQEERRAPVGGAEEAAPRAAEPDAFILEDMPVDFRRKLSRQRPADEATGGADPVPPTRGELRRALAQARELVDQLTEERQRLADLVDHLVRRLEREDSP